MRELSRRAPEAMNVTASDALRVAPRTARAPAARKITAVDPLFGGPPAHPSP